MMPVNYPCLVPACCGKAYQRGLCMKCYSQAKKKVQSRSTTWEELESLGLANPEMNQFDKELQKRKEKRDGDRGETEAKPKKAANPKARPVPKRAGRKDG